VNINIVDKVIVIDSAGKLQVLLTKSTSATKQTRCIVNCISTIAMLSIAQVLYALDSHIARQMITCSVAQSRDFVCVAHSV
jgi:alkyl hydroperoxide reductase subunit AhpC